MIWMADSDDVGSLVVVLCVIALLLAVQLIRQRQRPAALIPSSVLPDDVPAHGDREDARSPGGAGV